MAKSIDLALEPSRLASLLLSYIPAVCAFVAPRHPGASAAIFDDLAIRGPLSQSGELRPIPAIVGATLHAHVEAARDQLVSRESRQEPNRSLDHRISTPFPQLGLFQ